MIALRRFGPLIALVLVGYGVVLARMAQVQLGEHEIWAREAAGLVRSSQTLPYHRGRILDRAERVIVQDEDAYEIELVYRTFRREHPLGQIAHARAALELRPVSLHLAAREMLRWGIELVSLRPEQVADFARGGALHMDTLELAATADPEAEARPARAGELRYYLQHLLGASGKEWRDVRETAQSQGGRSFLELVAARQKRAPSALAAELVDGWRASLARLEQLAWLLALEGEGGAPALSPEEAFVHLIEALQRTRDGVDDSIAAELFRLAAGFPAARVEPEVLLTCFELGWIRTALRWSEARLELWATGLREAFRENWDALFVEAATIRALLSEEGGAAERLLDEYARLFDAGDERGRGASDWRAVDSLVAFAELEGLFEPAPPVPPPAGPILPFQRPELRAVRAGERDPWSLLAEMALEPGAERRARALAPESESESESEWTPPADGAELAARMRAFAEPGGTRDRPAREDRRLLPAWFVGGWERRYEEALGEWLVAAAAGGPLRIDAPRRERALEQLAYVVRDRGSRPVALETRPSYEVVQMITRFPRDFRGFGVRQTTRRRAVALDEAGRPALPELIGVVRESSLREVIEQRELGRRLAELRRKTLRDEEDREEMSQLVGQLYRNDELHGSSGVEGLYDEWLRGVNGYRESEGLEERAERSRKPFYQAPVDGRDVRLTIDLELQAAAQRVLEHPVLPPGETQRDTVWFANPVGAICLITVEGEVLAAASVPREPGAPLPGRDGEHTRVLDRTLRLPGFHPLGSIFKPFVAAYALDRMGLDPREQLVCAPTPELGVAGYGHVRCNSRRGHGAVDLQDALEHSCNAYFARLGERLSGREEFRELATLFGFGQPTGVSREGLGRGLVEDFRMAAFTKFGDFDQRKRQQAGNGLNVIEGTPLQAARAFAGLATGALPTLRLDVPTEQRPPIPPRRIELSERALAAARRALVGVVERGSASGKRLGRADLGFQLAAKTGSADYLDMTDELRWSLGGGDELPDMRKHTWLAGWFPAEAPRVVVVVYCHDVAFTSSRTAVHLASQLLRSPELQRLAAEGAR